MPQNKILTKERQKQLLDNANMMLQQGYSDADIQEMSKQFIEEYGVEEVKKKGAGEPTIQEFGNGSKPSQDTPTKPKVFGESITTGIEGIKKTLAESKQPFEQPKTKQMEPQVGGELEWQTDLTPSKMTTKGIMIEEKKDGGADFGLSKYVEQQTINTISETMGYSPIDVRRKLTEAPLAERTQFLYSVNNAINQKVEDTPTLFIDAEIGQYTQQQNKNKQIVAQLEKTKEYIGLELQKAKSEATKNINQFATINSQTEPKSYFNTFFNDGLQSLKATNPEQAKTIQNVLGKGIRLNDVYSYNAAYSGYISNINNIDKKINDLIKLVPTNEIKKKRDKIDAATNQQDYNTAIKEYEAFVAPYKNSIDELQKLSTLRDNVDSTWKNNYKTAFPEKYKLDEEQKLVNKEYEEGGIPTKAYYQLIAPIRAWLGETGESAVGFVGNSMSALGFIDKDLYINARKRFDLGITTNLQPEIIQGLSKLDNVQHREYIINKYGKDSLVYNQQTSEYEINKQSANAKEVEEYVGTGVNWDAIVPTMVKTTAQSYGFYSGGLLFGGKSALAKNVAQFGSVFVQSMDMNVQQAIDNGMSFDDAMIIGAMYSTIEGLSERIVPEEKIWGGLSKLSGSKLNKFYDDALNLHRLGMKGNVKQFATAMADLSIGYVKSVAPEIGEEFISQIGQAVTDTVYNKVNDANKGDIEVSPLDYKTLKNIALETMVGMTPTALLGGVGNMSTMKKVAMYSMGKEPQVYKDALKDLLESGQITKEKYDKQVQKVDTVSNIYEMLPNETTSGIKLNDDAKIELLNKYYAKSQLTAEKKVLENAGATEEDVKVIDEQIKEKSSEIVSVISTGKIEEDVVDDKKILYIPLQGTPITMGDVAALEKDLEDSGKTLTASEIGSKYNIGLIARQTIFDKYNNLKPKQYAVQKPTATEEMLRPKIDGASGELGLQGVEQKDQPKVITEESKTEEVVQPKIELSPIELTQEEISDLDEEQKDEYDFLLSRGESKTAKTKLEEFIKDVRAKKQPTEQPKTKEEIVADIERLNKEKENEIREVKRTRGLIVQQTLIPEIEAKYNTQITELEKQYEKEPTKKEDGEPMSGGVQGVRLEGQAGKESAELRPEEEEVADPLKDVESTAKALEAVENKTISKLIDFISIPIKALRRDKGEKQKKDLTWYAIDEDYLSPLIKPTKPVFEVLEETNDKFVFTENGVRYEVDSRATFEDIKSQALRDYNEKVNIQDNYYALSPENVFDIKNKNHFNKLKSYLINKLGEDKASVFLEDTFGSSNFDDNLTDDVFESEMGLEMVTESNNPYKEIGFDAIKFKEGGKDIIALFDPNKVKFGRDVISEAYHKAKADDSNPKLVEAVEQLLGKPKEAAPQAAAIKPEIVTEKEVAETAKKTGITPKNLRDLYKINRELFGLDRIKSLASAIAMDRMVGAMAKRANITKAEMYRRLKFEKASEEFVKGLSEKAKVLWQIVGENAQLAKDVRDNLQVARDMETAGKDAKTIRLATGWEKGKDGKWRYEIFAKPPFNVKLNLKFNQPKVELTNDKEATHHSQKLGDIINFPQLFEAYPKLKNLQVDLYIGGSDGVQGSYSSAGEYMLGIELFAENEKLALSGLLHEIQHAIQDIEGFARGGSPESTFSMIEKQLEVLSNGIEDIEKNVEKYGWDKWTEVSGDTKELLEQDKKLQKRLSDEVLKGFSKGKFEIYQRLAGEVEARNVQTRMAMTPEQRRETLLSETEDVARDEQIVLFDSKGIQMQVDAWHGSPYQFDKFTTEKIGTGEGAQAFGWGLYFTDLESIARNYAEKLAKAQYDAKSFGQENIGIANRAILNIESTGSVDNAIKFLKDLIEKNKNGDTSKTKEILDFIEKNKDKFTVSKNLYKVSLHKGKTPDQYTWLEWDKPVSEKIRNAVKDYILEHSTKDRATQLAFMSAGVDFDYSTDGRKITKVYIPLDLKGIDLYNLFVRTIYNIQSVDNTHKQASLDLLNIGIDGIKYPAESISRGATSDTARGFNYVVFDENAVSIEEVIKFQKDAEKARGAMMISMDGQAVIYALTDPNVSTPLHEMAHVFEHYLTDAERVAVQNWAGTKAWTTQTSEAFARGFEKYLVEGKAPTPALQKIFEKFKQWLTDIYNGIKGSEIDIELNEKMREIYAKMLGEEFVAPTKEAAPQEGSVVGGTDTTLKDVDKGVPFIKKIFDKIRSATKLNKVQHNRLFNIDTKLSKEIADAYEKMKHDPNNPKVKKAYEAMVEETKQQYNALVEGGLKAERWTGEGEPYANSAEMLKDLKENNHLWFLPNESAFGDKGAATKYKDNIGLQDSGITLDGNPLTNSEVFRVVHDAVHGINGSEFGAIGEENATLQHLSMYSDEALPAVVAQTRGQNSWVNFSGVNDSANAKFKEAAKLEKEGKYDEAKKIRKEAQKEFIFAEPKIGLLPNKYNFRYYGTKNAELASKERANARSGDGNTKQSESISSFGYEKDVARESKSFSSRSNSGGRTIRTSYGDIVPKAIHTVKQSLVDGIKKTFPKSTVDKELFEIDADTFHKAATKAKSVNEFGAAVDVLSIEEYSKYRLFITEDGLTGIALSPTGDLGSGFDMSGKPRRLPQLLVLGIENGATHANAFHTILPDYYTAFGFKPVARNLWNEALKPEDWNYETFKKFNNGRPDVVHFIWDGGDRNNIHERIGQFDDYDNYYKEQTPIIDTWEEAQEIVAQSLQATPQAGSVVGASLRDVELKMRRPEKNEVIFVSVDALLQKHAADQPSYDVQKESNRIKGRVEKAKEFIKNYIKDQRAINPKTGERMNTKVSFEPSVVDIDANGKISFEDGRHRVLAAKEMGLIEVPIEVPKERVKAVEQSLQSTPQAGSVVGSENPALKDVESTAKALENTFDDKEKYLVLKHTTGALRQNLINLEYILSSDKDIEVGKEIAKKANAITNEMEANQESGGKSISSIKNELGKFKKQLEPIRELLNSVENNDEIQKIKKSLDEVSEESINDWIKANSIYKAKKYHEAKAKGIEDYLTKSVEELLGKPKEATPQAGGIVSGEVEVKKTTNKMEGTNTFTFKLGDANAIVKDYGEPMGVEGMPSWAKKEHYVENLWRDKQNEKSKGFGLNVILKILQNAKENGADIVTGKMREDRGSKLHEYYKSLGFKDIGKEEPDGVYIDLRTNKPIEHIQKLIAEREQSLQATPQAGSRVGDMKEDISQEEDIMQVFEDIAKIDNEMEGKNAKELKELKQERKDILNNNPKSKFIIEKLPELRKMLKFEQQGKCR